MKLKEIVSFKFSWVSVLSWVAFYPKVINKLAATKLIKNLVGKQNGIKQILTSHSRDVVA